MENVSLFLVFELASFNNAEFDTNSFECPIHRVPFESDTYPKQSQGTRRIHSCSTPPGFRFPFELS